MTISILFSLFILGIDAHGRFSKPTPRSIGGGGGPNAPTYVCSGPVFGNSATSMRCHDAPNPGPITTVTAGTNLDVEWIFEAAHPGDCSIWISYDQDKAAPENWVKLKDLVGCLSPNGQTPTSTKTSIAIPKNIPNCDHCVMRWEWYAVQQVTNVEFYIQCFDVKIVGGNDNCNPPAPTTAISDAKYLGDCPFYNPYNGAFDPNRSKGPAEFSAPLTCGGAAPPAPAPTPAPTPPPPPTPPTPPPTPLPTPPPTSTPPASSIIEGQADFKNTFKGLVYFIQYTSRGPVYITVSLKNTNDLSTKDNIIEVRDRCTSGKVFDPTKQASFNRPQCVGCLSDRKCGGNIDCYNGVIGDAQTKTTNVQHWTDDLASLNGEYNIGDKYLAIMKGATILECQKITTTGQKTSSSAQHTIGIILPIISLLTYFLF